MSMKDNLTKEKISEELNSSKGKIVGLYKKNKSEIIKTTSGLVLACVITVGSAAMVQPNAYSISYDGKLIGYAKTQTEMKKAVEELETQVEKSVGNVDVCIDWSPIEMEAIKVNKNKTEFLTSEEITEILLAKEAYTCKAYMITVDGKNVVAAATEEEANAILNQVKDSYKTAGAETEMVSYKEEVKVVSTEVKGADLMDAQNAVNYIKLGTANPKNYTVKDGDTLWDVAQANGMTSAQLVAANPGFDPNKLKIGQELNLIAMEPFLTVVTKEKVTATEKIPFETKYEKSRTLFKGKTKIKTAGINGEKQTVSEVVKENGKVISEKVVLEKVLSEPVNQVAYAGTKAVTYTASASGGAKSTALANPLSSIQISSGYGANRGSRRHLGVDLRSPKGTPIHVTGNGVVTKVSSGGSYGKLVVVSHGNGLTTKYAHCNSICVSVGDTVSTGQQIGTVGSTGNATGNVLHYEVLVNGSNKNPVNYLN